MKTITQTARTDGPWNVSKPSAPHFQSEISSEVTGRTIAVTYNDEGGQNGALIASAPDLLDALRETILLLQTTLFDLELRLEIDGYLTTRDHEKIPEFRRRIASSIAIVSNIDKNRAAIAKATEGGE